MEGLVSLTKAQVPEYLVGTEFSNSLSADDEEEFSIPQKFLKPNVNVNSGAELAHLFHTMKFWGMMKLPDNIIELIIFKSRAIPDQEAGPIRDVLVEFDAEFKLSELHERMRRCSSKFNRLNAATASGREDVLEYVIRVDGQINTTVIHLAAEHGFFHLLQRITNEYSPPPGKGPFDKVSTVNVAKRGYSDCLRYLLENGCKKEKFTCQTAAENGQLACLKIAHQHGCTWNVSVLNAAAGKGQLDCLQYAVQHSSREKVAETACRAAECGQLACLEYILDQGIKPTKSMCIAACGYNGLNCLKLLRGRGALLDVACARRAAMSGNVLCLQFLLDEGCKVDDSVALKAVEWKRDQCLELLLANGCAATRESVNYAARKGKLSSMKIFRKFNVPVLEGQVRAVMLYCRSNTNYIATLFEAGYAIPQCAVELAARNGDDECVEYICVNRCCHLNADLAVEATTTLYAAAVLKILHAYKCPWDTRVCAELARHNDIAGLKFAHENGCPWDASTTRAALERRTRQCLEYAINHGCPVGENACELAAENGWCDILQYFHEHGSALTLSTCVEAALYRRQDCLEYAVLHGAPMDESICVAAVTVPAPLYQGTQLRMLQCARALGCPWDERVSQAAAESGDTATLCYCVEHGCPISKATMEKYNHSA